MTAALRTALIASVRRERDRQAREQLAAILRADRHLYSAGAALAELSGAISTVGHSLPTDYRVEEGLRSLSRRLSLMAGDASAMADRAAAARQEREEAEAAVEALIGGRAA